MEKKVISASRTKDLVRNSPELLALVLEGEAPCKLTFGGKSTKVSLDEIHTLVLWTKTPFNILEHNHLHEVLDEFVNKHQGLIALQLTVTGFGGTFIEYNVPRYQEVAAFMPKLFEGGLVFPESVMLRYDPFFEIEVMPGYILSNMQINLFKKVVKTFAGLGIKTFATSRMDPNNYPSVSERIEDLGLKIHYPLENEAMDFVSKMDDVCMAYGAKFKVCCDPDVPDLMHRRGCINGKLFNAIHQKKFLKSNSFCSEERHNKRGMQRPNCQCTYSQDIGYSKGFTMCYPRQHGCLYCYSQWGLNRKLKEKIIEEINAFKTHPLQFTKKEEWYQSLLVSQSYANRLKTR